MIRTAWVLSATVCATLALSACGSARFGGGEPVAAARPTYNAPMNEPIAPVPSEPVSSAPLAPPPGAPAPVAATDLGAPGAGPVMSDVPGQSAQPAPMAPQPAPPQVASAEPSRSSIVGGWTARDASGASCRVQLSSSPALDLYRASSSGCSNKDLSKVTAWDFRGGEVYLYQPGGAVAARLRTSGGALQGVLAKSGAPLTLAR